MPAGGASAGGAIDSSQTVSLTYDKKKQRESPYMLLAWRSRPEAGQCRGRGVCGAHFANLS